MKWYSRWSMSNHGLSEEKRTKNELWLQRNWSILMSSQDIRPWSTVVEIYFQNHPNMIAIVLLKVNDVLS